MKIRLSVDLKKAVEAAAHINGRTLNAEIVQRLESSFEADKQAKAFMEGDPLMGIAAMSTAISQQAVGISSLVMKLKEQTD